MRFRFLALDKNVTLKSTDRVRADLTLVRFHYDYDLDGNALELSGRVDDDHLDLVIMSAGADTHQSIPLEAALYPTSIALLYPLLHGLEVGREHAYLVFDGETQSLAPVTQAITGYERSDRFEGDAFKIETTLHGHRVTTWLDGQGRPLLEIAAGGVFIAELESEAGARRHLALAALNKEENLLDFSRVPVDRIIENPLRTATLVARFSGFGDFEVPSDARQRCRSEALEVRCEVDARRFAVASSPDHETYLESTLPVPSRHPRIRSLARQIAADSSDPRAQIEALVEWIQANVEQEPVDVFSALDVLATRKAECQGNT